MAVSPVTSASTSALAPVRKQTLDQSDFIRLLTTQMKTQDPTDPVDNKDTIAQMAQFSSLAGLDKVNETLGQISAQLAEVLAAQKSAQPTQNPA